MANIYVRSTDGSDADNGSTWALAKATLTGAAAIDAAGDFIYVSQSHAESTASAVTLAFAGTAASPTRIIAGNDAAEPPTAVSTAASITTTGNSTISLQGAAVWVYGVSFLNGTGANNVQSQYAPTTSAKVTLVSCSVQIPATGSTAGILSGNGPGHQLTLQQSTVKFGAAGQGIRGSASGHFTWEGGSILSGGTSPTTLISSTSQGWTARIDGVDLSNGGTSMNLAVAGNGVYVVWRNCKLPASWSGSLVTGTLQANERHEMHNCDSADTNYRLWIADYTGQITSETVVVRTGGASDGTTALSWKMITTANAEYPLLALASPEIVQWNETTGSAITATVEIVTDNVTLTDAECWLEVQYLGTSGYPLGSFISDAKADVLATAANQTSSSETWTTTGLGTPVKQKLSVTFTPQEKGFIHAVVKVAKASTTVYVDPLLTIT